MKIFFLILLIPQLIFAGKAFEINERAYKKMDKIALEVDSSFGGDKGSNGHDYTSIYSLYFAPIREKKLNLLEIGIYKGASVKFWENYFPNADLNFIDLNFETILYFSNRSHYYRANQENASDLIDVMKKIGKKMDIIIDDGGHKMNQQITSFITLWSYLKSGGLYIIEDLHTSYWQSHGGEGTKEVPLAKDGTCMQFLKDLIDDVNFVGARTSKASHKNNLSHIEKELNPYRKEILGMHFYGSLCVIIKR